METLKNCFMCSIKLNTITMLTNRCKCNHTFCNSHKYAEHHNCSFDHKKVAQRQLAKENVQCISIKVETI